MGEGGRSLCGEQHQDLLVSVQDGRYDPPPTEVEAPGRKLNDERADRLRRRGLCVQDEDGRPAWLPARGHTERGRR